jgi:hypothetical protein
MIEDHYLIRGLDALCRAHETNYFMDGHRGAAMIAAYYLCRDAAVEEGVSQIVGDMIDEHWTHTDLCAPFPSEAADSDGLDDILKRVDQSMGALRQVGHNVILPSLALKAFQQLPEAMTPSRVKGLCALIDSFTAEEGIFLDKNDTFPDLSDPVVAAHFVLGEFLRTIEAFDGRGQGWSGHLLTYGQALVDLRELGYGSLAHSAEYGFKLYIKRIRMGPLETDKPRREHEVSDLHPQQRVYWEHRRTRSVEIGHLFKYPYGFYGLMQLAEDSDLKRRCAEAAYHIF